MVFTRWDIWRVCTEGPEEELWRRCHTAVLVTSLAALELAREEHPFAIENVRQVAGYSFGEIGALVFAEALDLENALKIVELSAATINIATALRAAHMIEVYFSPDANLLEALQRAREHAACCGVNKPICEVASYLYTGCIVVAGDEEALIFLEREGATFGLQHVLRLQVTGAAHTAAMLDVERTLSKFVSGKKFNAPRVATWCCASARRYTDAADVRRGLARHVTRPVRWEQTLHAMYARRRGDAFPLTLALGPGGALRSTLRQVNARAWDVSVQVEV